MISSREVPKLLKMPTRKKNPNSRRMKSLFLNSLAIEALNSCRSS